MTWRAQPSRQDGYHDGHCTVLITPKHDWPGHLYVIRFYNSSHRVVLHYPNHGTLAAWHEHIADGEFTNGSHALQGVTAHRAKKLDAVNQWNAYWDAKCPSDEN